MYQDAAKREESELDKALAEINKTMGEPGYIPEGFEHLEGSIEEGYVIKNTDKGDEFVWIPVETPVLDLSNNLDALASDTTIKNAVQAEIDEGRYPMAIKTNTQDQYGIANYIGVLYGFDINEAGDAVEITPASQWTPLGTNRREPANLTGIHSSTGYVYDSQEMFTYQNAGTWTETLYQEEYNELVESVIANNGFYIGRYESGNLESTAVSQKGATGINNQTWYQMYKAQKNIYGDAAEAKTHMIWGSQYDQVLIWMKDIPNTSENAYESFYILDSTDMGVYYNNDEEYWDERAGKFEVKKVYDLGGNVREWSMQANTTTSRPFHGGCYDDDSVEDSAIRIRNSIPTSVDDKYGSRLTLYK